MTGMRRRPAGAAVGDDRAPPLEQPASSPPPASAPVVKDRSQTPAPRPPTRPATGCLGKRDWALLAALTAISLAVHLHRLDSPPSVVFDEVHFGGFMTKYIQGRYFFDVHPPLGKLLFAWTAELLGYEGHFSFSDIGLAYLASVPYVGLRMLSAVCGALLSPIAYLTLRTLGHFEVGALLAAALLMVDVALGIQTRLILLDAPLLLFIALTVLCYVAFVSVPPSRVFGVRWHLYLLLSGLFLGAAASVKMVGLFTVAWVGFHTIAWLWSLLCDATVPLLHFSYHFLWRAVSLIAVPVAVYLACFHVHFARLPLSGPGDGHMSLDFQLTLDNNPFAMMFADVHYGARVFIQNCADASRDTLLHSHADRYPQGVTEQQVTGATYRDINSGWLFEAYLTSNSGAPVRGQQTLRLKHESTHAFLRVAPNTPAPVSGRGANLVFAAKQAASVNDDLWQIRLVGSADQANGNLTSITSQFYLMSKVHGCYLTLMPNKLPQWGFGQREMACVSVPVPEARWRITRNEDESRSQRSRRVGVQPMPFVAKFIELQKLMWTVNEQLTSSHPYQSSPGSWPLYERGVTYWYKNGAQIHALPNPFVWWTAAAAVPAFCAVAILLILRAQRGFQDRSAVSVRHFESAGWLLFSAWALHYLPFFLMQRQLFIHHYLSALYLSVLLLGVVADFITRPLPLAARYVAVAALIAAAARYFHAAQPLLVADPWSAAACEEIRWRSSWDITCADPS